MTDPMSIEDCRRAQISCATRVQDQIAELRRETRDEIAAIREAVQGIDRSVAQIKGHLGINGATAPPPTHPHRRDSEETEHLHRRLEDAIASSEAAVSALAGRQTDGITLPKWAVYASAVVLVLIVVLAAAAGERGMLWLIRGAHETGLAK